MVYINVAGMSINSCNPRLGYGVTQVMSNHYPERLGLVIILNHSPVFQGVLRAIKVGTVYRQVSSEAKGSIYLLKTVIS